MALNPYFTQGTKNEQNLVQDLINEQLRMYGVEIYYIPRKYMTTTKVIREVIESEFDDAYPIEAYVKSDVYEGAGILLSKFGVQQQDDITVLISRERWETYIEPLIENDKLDFMIISSKENNNKKKQLRGLSQKFLNLQQLQRTHNHAMKWNPLRRRANPKPIPERPRSIQNPLPKKIKPMMNRRIQGHQLRKLKISSEVKKNQKKPKKWWPMRLQAD